jgi:hypothetical protein
MSLEGLYYGEILIIIIIIIIIITTKIKLNFVKFEYLHYGEILITFRGLHKNSSFPVTFQIYTLLPN